MLLHSISILPRHKSQRTERVARPALCVHLQCGAREPGEDVELRFVQTLLSETLLEDGAQLVRDVVDRGCHHLLLVTVGRDACAAPYSMRLLRCDHFSVDCSERME